MLQGSINRYPVLAYSCHEFRTWFWDRVSAIERDGLGLLERRSFPYDGW